MGYFSNLDLDRGTCGQTDEDTQLDRRDGLTSRRRGGHYQYQRRTREEWAALESESGKASRERIARIAARIRQGMSREDATAAEAHTQAQAREAK